MSSRRGGGGGMEDGGVINCNGLWFENSFHIILYSLLHSKGSYWDKVRVRVEQAERRECRHFSLF